MIGRFFSNCEAFSEYMNFTGIMQPQQMYFTISVSVFNLYAIP